MRSRNIKCKTSSVEKVSPGKVGSVSCLLLLLLTFLAVNPITSSAAFAEEVHEESGDTADSDGPVADTVMLDDEGNEEDAVDDEIELYADTTSTVTIAFLPTSATGTVTPLDSSNGDKAKVDVKATVRVQNSGGYKVYVGSSSSQLKNGTNAIDSVTSATTYANLPINRWGYSFQEGSTVKDSYVAMPATLRSTALYSNTSTNITDETKTFMLSFAARIGSDKPSGTYSNSVTMSVVSSPLSVAEEVAYDFGGITDMQSMTTAICNAAPTGGVKQLKDTRDGKYYWIGKMKDGKCWMTQNLDLDLTNDTSLSSATSDLGWTGTAYPATAKTWNPPYTTATIASSSTILASDTGTRSWSLGNYSIMNPSNSTSCGTKLESAEACSGSDTKDRFKYYVTPTSANGDTNAHYILGNHYQWNAATAGTGGTITSGQASDSICPRNWRLPTSNTGGEFAALVTALGGTSSTNYITNPPFYGVRGGAVWQDSDLFDGPGNLGRYWSSTPYSNSNSAYILNFGSTTYVTPSNFTNRQLGFSVRCVAR